MITSASAIPSLRESRAAIPTRLSVRRRLGKRPIHVREDLLLPLAAGHAFDNDLDDLLRVMGRCPGCLGCSCRRADPVPGSPCYRIESRWTSGDAFVAWTQTTLFAAVAAQLAGRRLSIEPAPERK
jgi:heme-degrading monooxygenase HmoA